MVELMTTDLLSPNIYALVMMGSPRYLSVFLRSIICSVAVLAATNSEPYVAVSTVACLFENQPIGVVLTKCNTAVTDFPVTMSSSRLTSRNVVVITLFPDGWGMSFGISSLTFPKTVLVHSYSCFGRCESSGSLVLYLIAKCLVFARYPYNLFILSKCPILGADLNLDIDMTCARISYCPG